MDGFEIYARDLVNFRGPKRTAFLREMSQYQAMITLWSILVVLALPLAATQACV